jgi:hypothetical protein
VLDGAGQAIGQLTRDAVLDALLDREASIRPS